MKANVSSNSKKKLNHLHRHIVLGRHIRIYDALFAMTNNNIVFPAAALSNAAIIELNERLDEIISTGDVSEALHMLQHVAAVFVPSDEA